MFFKSSTYSKENLQKFPLYEFDEHLSENVPFLKYLTLVETKFWAILCKSWTVLFRLDDLQEANKDDFSFDELFDELFSDEQYQQYQ